MKAFLKSSIAILLLVFISCNPDEDLDNNGNSGNNGNNGNNSGGNTVNPVSYPEIVNLLEGNWYGDSIVAYYADGSKFMTYDPTGTMSVGYLTFGPDILGSVDFNPPSDGITMAPPYEDLIVNKYPAAVEITNGSWSGTGLEQLTSANGLSLYAWEMNVFSDKSYVIVDYTTPCFNISTPTIQYGILTGSDIRIGGFFSETQSFIRIHTLNSTTLRLIAPWDGGGYVMYSFTKQ
jgi:hypothetical protein